MCSLFYKQVARELSPNLAIIFERLVKGGSFPAWWRLADVVPVPKESSSSDVGDYRYISIIYLLSMAFEKIMTGKLSYFLESNSLLPPQFALGLFSWTSQMHLIG